MTPFTFNTAPSLVFGSGSIARLGEIAAQRLGPRVALVTDAGLMKAGLIASALRALEEAGVAVDVFDAVVADPPEDVVLAAVEKAKKLIGYNPKISFEEGIQRFYSWYAEHVLKSGG